MPCPAAAPQRALGGTAPPQGKAFDFGEVCFSRCVKDALTVLTHGAYR